MLNAQRLTHEFLFSCDSSHKKPDRFPIPVRESATLHDEMVSIGIL
jgi:hypothetical protein